MFSRIKRSYRDFSWEVQSAPSSLNPKFSNADMDPVMPALRTWSTLAFCLLWISDSFNAATWELSSSMVSSGLSWKQSLAAVIVAQICIVVPIILNGTAGALVHVPFPVMNRSSFGFWFSYFCVISRAVLAIFWFGVQSYTGGECVRLMIKAIWPSFANFKNHIPASENITSAKLLSYFLFWLIQEPFLFIHPRHIKYLFMAKAVLTPIAFIGMFIWGYRKTGGGPIFQTSGTLSGSDLAWVWLGALNSSIGNWATWTVNIADITRYAKSPRSTYAQAIIIPISFTFVCFIGIAVTSAGAELYGSYYWDPTELMDEWDMSSSLSRAALFFCAASFALATLGVNISGNSISAGNDLTAMMPKYINIRRGCLIASILGGWCLTPWNILASATSFLNFMSGYTIFLGPICGIMVADFWLVSRRKIDVQALYEPKGRYYYWNGLNPRALLAVLCAVIPAFPGFLQTIKSSIGSSGGIWLLGNITWLFTFTVSVIVYTTTSILWPPFSRHDLPVLGSYGVDVCDGIAIEGVQVHDDTYGGKTSQAGMEQEQKLGIYGGVQ